MDAASPATFRAAGICWQLDQARDEIRTVVLRRDIRRLCEHVAPWDVVVRAVYR
jgi:hypothetical protein